MKVLNRNDDLVKNYKDILDHDKEYWLELVFHVEDVYKIIYNLPNDIFYSIKYESSYLLISNEFECFDNIVYEIYDFLIIKYNIPEHKIVFLSGAKEIKKIVIKIKDEINKKYHTVYKGIDARFFGWFEYFISRECKKNQKSIIQKRKFLLNGKLDYKKHFLCLNRRWRLHRPVLVALLNNKNLLEKGYVSLGSNDQNLDWNSVYDNLLQTNQDNTVLYDILKEDKNKNTSLGYLTLDSEDFEYKQPNLVQTLDPYYMSFMSVVTETYFYDFDTLFLSEKTFRPIAYLQPFIIVSIPNTLEFIKELGYKTFHPYIDESYDKELDDCKRMLMIVNEIDRICNMSQQELKKLSIAVKDICYHNYDLLLSKIK